MLKSCSYCGKIHPKGYVCAKKPKREYKITNIDKFRWSKAWQKKREWIKKRDNYLCQICLRKLHKTLKQYNYDELDVHHIVPINEDWDKRLNDDNLITLCSYHHKMAEQGEISREELLNIVKEQEQKVKR